MTITRIPQATLTDLLFEKVSVGLCLVAPDGTVVRANEEWLRSTGFTEEQVVGENIIDLFPTTRDMALAMHARARAGHRVEVPRHAPGVDGRETWWEGSIESVPMEGGTGLLVTAREVTPHAAQRGEPSRSVAERGAGGEQQRYRSLFQYSLDALYLTRADGTILDANPAACHLHGMTVDEIKQAGRAGLIVNDGRHAAALRERATTGRARAELTVRRKDGTTVAVEMQSVLLDPAWSDSPEFLIARDISERNRVEEALRRREEESTDRAIQLEAILNCIADGAIVYDREGRTVRSNPAADEILNIPAADREAPVQDRASIQYEILSEEGRAVAREDLVAVRAALRGESIKRVINRVKVSGYEPRWLMMSATPLLIRGQHAGAVLSMTDITERKRAEEALRRSEERLRLAQQAARIGSFEWNLKTKRTLWSPELEALHGLTPGAIGGRYEEWAALVHPDDLPEVERRLRGSLDTGAFDTEWRIVRPDGKIHWVAARGQVFKDEGGQPVRMVGVNLDITERKEMEDALREADRRKDEFLGMLSHELRNPLAPIRNSTYILRHAQPGSEQARRAQTVIERQSQHLTRLVDDLLDVTRIGRGKIELRRDRVEVGALVRRAVEDFRPMIEDKGVALHTALPATKLWAEADPTRITQVVGNLLHNAAKFTQGGGEVMVAVERDGHMATIQVRDSGAGIDPELLPRIFDAFVQGERTLARTDGGLGLGLALVKGIAELHGGSVHAESAGEGKGSAFTVRLPLLEALDYDVSPAPRMELRTRGRRVLVVDDNTDAAESLAELVRMLGHTAEVAYDGASAVEKVRANPVNVVLCDIGLPGMSGYEVAKALRAMTGDGMRLFAVSGYAQPEDIDRAIKAGFDGHVAKPCDPEKIERLLG